MGGIVVVVVVVVRWWLDWFGEGGREYCTIWASTSKMLGDTLTATLMTFFQIFLRLALDWKCGQGKDI